MGRRSVPTEVSATTGDSVSVANTPRLLVAVGALSVYLRRRVVNNNSSATLLLLCFLPRLTINRQKFQLRQKKKKKKKKKKSTLLRYTDSAPTATSSLGVLATD